jgi:tetrahydromethanopterin S-methyltransferase subunit F
MWFCKIANLPQIVGPLSDNQLRALARQGRLQPTDVVAQDQNGPWYPASQVRGLFGQSEEPASAGQPPQQIPVPVIKAAPEGVPSSRQPQKGASVPTPEDLLRQRAQRRRRARKLTLTLVWSGLALGFVFLLVLMRPVISSMLQTRSEKRPEARQSSEIARSPEDPAISQRVANIPGLDEVLGHTPREPKAPTKAAAETPEESRMARLTKLIAASQAFGATAQKLRDSHGEIEMTIEDCRIAPVSLRQGGLGFRTPRPYFVFKLRIRNTSAAAARYRSPREGGQSAEIWWEKAAQPLSPWQRAGFTLEGQIEAATLGPGETVVDTFAFELPPDDIPLIYVRIPGASVDLDTDDFLFVIAKDDIQRFDSAAKTSAGIDERDEASIGPMTPRKGESATQSDSRQADEEQAVMDEEAVPIPGIHDVPSSSVGENGINEEEQAKIEELRKRGEMMQDALDRQRTNQKSPPRSRSQRR